MIPDGLSSGGTIVDIGVLIPVSLSNGDATIRRSSVDRFVNDDIGLRSGDSGLIDNNNSGGGGDGRWMEK